MNAGAAAKLLVLTIAPWIADERDFPCPQAVGVSLKNPDDRVEVLCGRSGWTMVIHSPRGIGWAEVTPRQPWPDRVVIRLFLRGLEHLRIATGEFELVVSVRSYGDFAREVRLRKSPEGQGNEGPQSPGDPFWVKVKAHSAAGEETPGLPPPGGYWEIELPSQLFREHSCPLRLDWIDFYRY